jgi:hypothetical protein
MNKVTTIPQNIRLLRDYEAETVTGGIDQSDLAVGGSGLFNNYLVSGGHTVLQGGEWSVTGDDPNPGHGGLKREQPRPPHLYALFKVPGI